MFKIYYDNPQTSAALYEIERAAIFYRRLPICMTSRTYDCASCPLEPISSCPVKVDPMYRSYLLSLHLTQSKCETEEREQVEMLKGILKESGPSLHWQHLAVLALRQDLSLFPSVASIKSLAYFNPEIFSTDNAGIVTLRS
jgi:hypothetical protein